MPVKPKKDLTSFNHSLGEYTLDGSQGWVSLSRRYKNQDKDIYIGGIDDVLTSFEILEAINHYKKKRKTHLFLSHFSDGEIIKHLFAFGGSMMF